jgi:hypothetical protein
MAEFIVARNPSQASSLPYLVCLPLRDGDLWLKTTDSWPRGNRLYCHPLGSAPAEPVDILERTEVRLCVRRGPAIDLILARGINKRSQLVFVSSRGRPMIFWQTAKTARAARPGVRIPGTRSHQPSSICVDTRERRGYTFRAHGVAIERKALSVGDYAVFVDDHVAAVVERKTVEDFATAIVDGSLNFAMAELTSAEHAAVVIEGQYSALLRHAHTRPGYIPDLIARLQVRYPEIPLTFLESRKIAEEWTYRFLCAAFIAHGASLFPTDVGNPEHARS